MISNCLLVKCDKCRISLTKKGKKVETPVFRDLSEVTKALSDKGWRYDVTAKAPIMLCNTCRTGVSRAG